MTNRWQILTLLFLVRLSMAIQFQSVAAIAPVLTETRGLGLGDIGFLFALYFAPGLVFALPGGEIGRRFGDRETVMVGLVLMTVGGVVMALLPSWEAQIAGRLIAGIGGVLLNVLMSKMVTDAFAGREIATAMGIFVNSWPVGIALALLVLPAFATAMGAGATYALTAGLAVLGAAALLLLLPSSRPDNRDPAAASPSGRWPRGAVLGAVLAAGAAWTLYNAALAMIFGFGAAHLATLGWSAAAAGAATSTALWMVAVSVPGGGILADRIGRPSLVLLGGCAAFAACLAVLPHAGGMILPILIVTGLIAGLPAGPIMALPARVLAPDVRATGMGAFFTVFYLGSFIGPSLAGAVAEVYGTPSVAFTVGIGYLGLAALAVLLFQGFARRAAA